jgi:hypothetical protein
VKTTSRIATRTRRVIVAVAALAVLGAVACEDPFEVKAELTTVEFPFELWALSGSPVAFPTVMLVPQLFVARPDAAGSFDLGFDIDSLGQLVVLPVTKVVSSLSGPRLIGIIRANEPFVSVTEAPRSGWAFDSVLTFVQGETFIVRVETLYCNGQTFLEVYAKYQVDSILPAERRIKLTGRINRNCGFRSFADGIPTF